MRQLFDPLSCTYTYLVGCEVTRLAVLIDYAVPGNRRCGVCPEHLPKELKQYCEPMTESHRDDR